MQGPREAAYALGHASEELDRLVIQARLLAPITERFLREAGVRRGMRVLDVGSGTGGVSFLAADLVGPEGEVVGVDHSPAAIAAAARRRDDAGIANVRFMAGDPRLIAFDRPFDAIVGRYVLMYQADPGSWLAELVPKIVPGGLICFHELDWGGARTCPPSPLFAQCCQWIVEGLECGGADPFAGTKLCSAFERAGLSTPVMRLECVIGGVDEPAHRVRDLLATIFPIALESILVESCIVVADEIRPSTLERRLRSELKRLGSTIVGRSEVGAWTRTG